jgi:hypothetical protein
MSTLDFQENLHIHRFLSFNICFTTFWFVIIQLPIRIHVFQFFYYFFYFRFTIYWNLFNPCYFFILSDRLINFKSFFDYSLFVICFICIVWSVFLLGRFYQSSLVVVCLSREGTRVIGYRWFVHLLLLLADFSPFLYFLNLAFSYFSVLGFQRF